MRTFLALLLAAPLALGADAPKGKAGAPKTVDAPRPEAVVVQAEALEWKEAGGGLPAGAKMAVVAGDPSKEGMFTVRLRFPDGMRVQPHVHPAEEHVTVVAGTFHIARGDRFDVDKGDTLKVGDVFTMPANVPHYGWAEGDTVIQITATGPWDLTYTKRGT